MFVVYYVVLKYTVVVRISIDATVLTVHYVVF